MKKKIILGIAAVLLGLSSMPVLAEEFTLNRTKVTINVNNDVQTDLDVIGTDKDAVWTSYNENIVTVDEGGVLTAKRVGKTTVQARVEADYQKCSVNVVNPSIKLNKTSVTLYHGINNAVSTKVRLKATVKGADKQIIWESSNPETANVDEEGNVIPVHEGTATITATANGISASCKVTVKENDIVLDHEQIQLSTKGTGSSLKIKAVVTGPKKSIKWESADKTIATVSGGKITGKADGETIITATANGASTECHVKVIKGLVSLNVKKVTLYTEGTKNESYQLKTNAGKNDTLIWKSEDEKIATVDNKGKITPVGEGKTTISVTAGGKPDTCEVTVLTTKTDIKDEVVSLTTKGTDRTYILNKEIIGRSTSVKWKSSNTKVAKVSNGKLTGLKEGMTTISATANGKTDTVLVYVNVPAPTVTLNQKEYTLYTNNGNTVTLRAATDGTEKTITWESSDTSIATVNTKGKVTAVSEGTVVITAKANGAEASCNITVVKSSIRIGLEKELIILKPEGKAVIPADIIGYSQTLTWKSANSSVATVDRKGTVTAKQCGETDILLTANKVTEKCHIIVAECIHEFGEGIVTEEATCTETGTQTYTCSLCGETYEETIPLKEHTPGEWKTKKEATCSSKGEETLSCLVCGNTIRTREVPKAEHIYGDWEYQQRQSEDGIWVKLYAEETDFAENDECPSLKKEEVYDWMRSSHSCKDCGKVEEKEAHIHQFEKAEVEKCLYKYDLYRCKVCGLKVYDNNTKCERTHDIHLEDEGSYLYGKSGKKTVSDVKITDPAEMDLHKYDYYVCGTCRECNKFFDMNSMGYYKDNLPLYAAKAGEGHEFEVVEHVEATCTTDGYEKIKCKYCPEERIENYTPALEHVIPEEYKDYVYIEDCGIIGDTDHICFGFHKEILYANGTPSGHYYPLGQTCLPEFTCERCGKTFTNPDPIDDDIFNHFIYTYNGDIVFNEDGIAEFDGDLHRGEQAQIETDSQYYNEDSITSVYGHSDYKCSVCGKEKTSYKVVFYTGEFQKENSTGIMLFPGESCQIKCMSDLPEELKATAKFKIGNEWWKTSYNTDKISFDLNTGKIVCLDWGEEPKNDFVTYGSDSIPIGLEVKCGDKIIEINNEYGYKSNRTKNYVFDVIIPCKDIGEELIELFDKYEITDNLSNEIIAKKVCEMIYDNMIYGNSSAGEWYDVWQQRQGVCDQYATLYTAIMRKFNIPTIRHGDDDLNHAWNKVWLKTTYDPDGWWYNFDSTCLRMPDIYGTSIDTTTEEIVEPTTDTTPYDEQITEPTAEEELTTEEEPITEPITEENPTTDLTEEETKEENQTEEPSTE